MLVAKWETLRLQECYFKIGGTLSTPSLQLKRRYPDALAPWQSRGVSDMSAN